LGFKHYSATVNLPQVSDEVSGKVLEVTFSEFVAKQKLFNRYTLTKTLGRGGMGVVWLARDDELERDVALKFLPELIIHDRAVLSDLKRETRRSLELTHKNIIRIYDFVYDQTSACISMEYVDGDTLSNLRADKPRKVFEPAELKGWVRQLCDALDYAHNHARIVHRDLKPANLMVNQRGDLKVSDFGIARSLSDSLSKLTMQHGRSGTLVYMSPQQLDGERGDHLDDVYSLGASVYELLTSKPPFYSGNVDRQIREKIPPTMTQRRKELEIEGEPIDAVWEKVVAACLAKDPTRRPQSVAEIASLLDVPSPKIVLAGDVRAKLSKNTALACAIRRTLPRRHCRMVFRNLPAGPKTAPRSEHRGAFANTNGSRKTWRCYCEHLARRRHSDAGWRLCWKKPGNVQRHPPWKVPDADVSRRIRHNRERGRSEVEWIRRPGNDYAAAQQGHQRVDHCTAWSKHSPR
jgi:serine/threonine protein kinase